MTATTADVLLVKLGPSSPTSSSTTTLERHEEYVLSK